MALTTGSVIHAEDLGLVPALTSDELRDDACGSLQDQLDQTERSLILDALQKTGGNRTAAARALGITFRSMRYRMSRLGLAD